jgi:murein DD-endopeptidase MepM/ murein hydrolase activator NlpD
VERGVTDVRWGRFRLPSVWAAFALLVVSAATDVIAWWIALVVFGLAFALYLRLGSPAERAPVKVAAPVVGRWKAVNSPADRIPSYGVHAYGQTYAIDLVGDGRDRERPREEWWPLTRSPDEFPAYGRDVLAPADGTVVHAHDSEPDHSSRSSWPAHGFLFVEGGLRELGGRSHLLGNHVVIDLGGGVWALLAHLQHESVKVRPGDRVAAGDVIARCGNSGSSGEPHVHFQLMDHENVLFADGVPFEFEYRRDGDTVLGVPPAEEDFVVEH